MPSNEHDDLTEIRGIGHRTATALGDELGVDRFAVLSAQTVDEISDALANAGLRRQPYAVIEGWIAEATQRSAVVKSAIEEGGGTETPTTALHDWRNEASFVVEFESRDVVQQVVEHEHQMVVHEIESDIGEHFAVDDGAGAFRWMLQKLEAARHAEAKAGENGVTAVAPIPAKEFVPDVTQALSVSYIELDQPPHLSKASADQAPENRNLGVARIREPLKFRVGFTIDDEHVDALAEAGVGYTAEVYVQAWAGDTVRIGPTDPGLLTGGTGDYELAIRHSFDAVGIYRVRAAVNLTTEAPVGDYLEAAMLQVY